MYCDEQVRVLGTKDLVPSSSLQSDLPLSVLDLTIPPCYLTFAWAFDNDSNIVPDVLSQSLLELVGSHFQCLAAKLVSSPKGSSWKLVPARPPHPVRMIMAQCSSMRVADVREAPPLGLSPLMSLNPRPSPSSGAVESPLLVVQFTQFSDGGYVIALVAHHLVLDGLALVQLGSLWLCASSPAALQHRSSLEALLVGMPTSKQPLLPCTGGLQVWDAPPPSPPSPPSMLLVSRFPSVRVRKAVEEVNSSSEHAITPNDVVSAAMWLALVRSMQAVGLGQQYSELGLVVDVRKDLFPPSAPFLVGNCVLYSSVRRTQCELVKMSLAEAASIVRRSIVEVHSSAASVVTWCASQQAHPSFSGFSTPVVRAVMGGGGLALSNWTGIHRRAYEACGDKLLHFFCPPSGMAMHGFGVVEISGRDCPPEDMYVSFGIWRACAQQCKKELQLLLGAAVFPACSSESSLLL